MLATTIRHAVPPSPLTLQPRHRLPLQPTSATPCCLVNKIRHRSPPNSALDRRSSEVRRALPAVTRTAPAVLTSLRRHLPTPSAPAPTAAMQARTNATIVVGVHRIARAPAYAPNRTPAHAKYGRDRLEFPIGRPSPAWDISE